METKNIILGGGIAGLCYALYNPDHIVLTDRVGGGFSAPFQLGPKFLHRTPKTKQFLKDIGVIRDVPVKTVKVGFYYDDAIHSHNTDENRRAYFEKTRGVSGSETYKSSMSEGSEEFDAYDMDVEKIVNAVFNVVKDRVIIGKVSGVDLKNKIVKYGYCSSTQPLNEPLQHPVVVDDLMRFEKLVVTVPRPVFCYMIGQADEAKRFVSYPTTFLKSEHLPVDLHPVQKDFEKYDYVYFSQKEFPFHRVTKIPGGFCLEYKGDWFGLLKGAGGLFTLKIGQLIQRTDNMVYPDSVKFFGRYAEWRHSIKTRELIDELIK
ncbi:MAG: hypothetical protein ACYDBV_13120 [Nitrospiria bacterium]